MFIKNLEIKNFKCFDKEGVSLEFNMPDGKSAGSGLNIFVGENNSGKSTIFESIDFLRDGTKKDLEEVKNKNASVGDHIDVSLTFGGSITNVIDHFSQDNKKDVFKRHVYKNGTEDEERFKLLRTSADQKEIRLWDKATSEFKNQSGIDAPLKKLFQTNFVWSDTNPNTQASFGATTICGNLLKEIMNKFAKNEDYIEFSKQFERTFNDKESEIRKGLQNIERRTQEIVLEQFGDAKIFFRFDELAINSFFKNVKIEVDDGISTAMEEKGDGMQRSVVLALLQVYADELIKHPDNQDIVKPFFLFIDEPEICLHPSAQIKLGKDIFELSKTKQIFIATHSPYFFRNPSYKNAGLFLFNKDKNHKIEVSNINNENWGLLPWSPSWDEINYHAYNLPTPEFHNELYGSLQGHAKKTNVYHFDQYLQKCKSITETRTYKQKDKPNSTITLCTYIRHQIHHPENGGNKKYTSEELQSSIELLIRAIHSSR